MIFVRHIEFIVEEPSMETFLNTLLPRILGDIPFTIHAFQSKVELLKKLPARLKGYARWLPEDYRLVVLVDRDDDDCIELKRKLEDYALKVGLPTRSNPRGNHFLVVNRIVVEELEAWYFGDWEAVTSAYPKVSAAVVRRPSFRNPDGIKGGTWEIFQRELQRAGYYKSGLPKREVAAKIARHMDPGRNTSRSFQHFRDVLWEFVNSPRSA